MNKTTYLRFVDGLRAIAVLSVVAFHMELNSPSGGYTGVDIFFCHFRISDNPSNRIRSGDRFIFVF